MKKIWLLFLWLLVTSPFAALAVDTPDTGYRVGGSAGSWVVESIDAALGSMRKKITNVLAGQTVFAPTKTHRELNSFCDHLPGGFSCDNAAATGEISSCEELQKIGNDASHPLNGSYFLTADIDCVLTNPVNQPPGYAGLWSDGRGFKPIGQSASGLIVFDGQFDGRGFTIKNLYINNQDNYVGLFSKTSNSARSEFAVIQNLKLSNLTIIGHDNVGGLIGWAKTDTRVLNVIASGSISATGRNLGGLIGSAEKVRVINSVFFGSVIGADDGSNNVGGLIGEQTASAAIGYGVENCYASASVRGDTSVGGLIGNNKGYVKNSYFIGSVNAETETGGLIGQNKSNGFPQKTYVAAKVEARITGAIIGAFIGHNNNNSLKTTGIRSYWDRDVAGQLNACATNNCSSITGKTSAEMVQQAAYSGWSFLPATGAAWKLSTILPADNYYPCLSWQNDSSCFKVDFTTHIGSCVELQMIGHPELLSYCGADCDRTSYPLNGQYVLDGDIDCSLTNPDYQPVGYAGLWQNGRGFIPISSSTVVPFAGDFSGSNHVISRLYMRAGDVSLSLFGPVLNAKIKNFSIIDVNLVGAAANKAVGAISSDCRNTAISGVKISGSVVGGGIVGGLIGGSNLCTVADSGFKGFVASDSDSAGGVIGKGNGDIVNTYSNASVFGQSEVGGLFGNLTHNANIIRSYALGTVSGRSQIGGLVGKLFVGGGGVVNIADSFSGVYVPQLASNGGLIGYLLNAGVVNVDRCYVFGKFDGYNAGSPILVNAQSSNTRINSSYCDATVNPTFQCCNGAYCAGAKKKTTNQMTQEATFDGWNFAPPSSDTWKLSAISLAGVYYPCLSWQSDDTCVQIKTETTIVIDTCKELQMIGHPEQRSLCGADCDRTNYPLDANYVLASDIDCTATNPTTGGSIWNSAGFDPIGDGENLFAGRFDGDNRIISGLYIDRTGENFVGLFGASIGLVENVNLLDATIAGKNYVGTVVGEFVPGLRSIDYPYKNMSEVTVTNGQISGINYVGGVIGGAFSDGNTNGIKISGLSYSGAINGYGRVGGLIGGMLSSFSNMEIADCFARVTINATGGQSVGGLIGAAVNGTEIVSVFVEGDITSGGDNTGGIVGSTDGAVLLSKSSFYGRLQSTGRAVGGLAGATREMDLELSYAKGDIIGRDAVGGLIGLTDYNDRIENCYFKGQIELSGVNGYAGGFIGYASPGGGFIDHGYAATTIIGDPGSILGGACGRNCVVDDFYWNADLFGGSVCGSAGCVSNFAESRNTYDMTTAHYPYDTPYTYKFFNWVHPLYPQNGGDWRSKTQIVPVGNYYPCLTWQSDAQCSSS